MPRYLVSCALALVAALPAAARQFPAQQRGLTAETARRSPAKAD